MLSPGACFGLFILHVCYCWTAHFRLLLYLPSLIKTGQQQGVAGAWHSTFTLWVSFTCMLYIFTNIAYVVQDAEGEND